MKNTLNSEDAYLISIKKAIDDFQCDINTEEEGVVISVFDGVVKVLGLDSVSCMDLVEFKDSKAKGVVLGVNNDSVDVILLEKATEVKEGEFLKSLGIKVSIPVGKHLLGRVVDILGRPLDDLGEIDDSLRYDLERESPAILDRESVYEPMETGILCIDSAIPIGRGQRELIIGDRQTGKTSIAIDTIINQSLLNKTRPENEKVFSIYVAIGQKRSSIVNTIELLKSKGVFGDCVFVVASASDSATMQFLSPYAGSSIAEYFRDNGQHSLIIYDDLSKHAVAYREISLLLRRPPAREAYPGDIFYLHARLLERSAKLKRKDKNEKEYERSGGSMTALPIIETQAGDVSAYIPTNVISITDGQIFLESELFYQGVRPAINIGISVSRIGSAAQRKAIKDLAGSLKVKLAQFREIEIFAKFSSDLDDSTLKILENGKRTVSLLIQKNYEPLSIEEEIILLFILNNDLYLEKTPNEIKTITKDLRKFLLKNYGDLMNKILENGIKENKDSFYLALKDFRL